MEIRSHKKITQKWPYICHRVPLLQLRQMQSGASHNSPGDLLQSLLTSKIRKIRKKVFILKTIRVMFLFRFLKTVNKEKSI